MTKYCTNCGHEPQEGDKFCAECGAPVDTVIEPEVHQININVSQSVNAHESSSAPQRIRCPNPECPFPEDVQLISALVEAGRTLGTVSDAGYKVEMRSALSKQLMYANQPMSTWVLLLLILAIVPMFLGLSNLLSVVYGIGDGDVGIGVEDLLIALSFLVGALAFLIRGRRKNRHMKARWARAYYCNHCGNVFVPGEPMFVPPAHKDQLFAKGA